jgi:hypothetical protein
LHGLQSGCSVGEANPSEARWRRPRTWCVLKFVPGPSHNPMQAGPRRGVEHRFVSAGDKMAEDDLIVLQQARAVFQKIR